MVDSSRKDPTLGRGDFLAAGLDGLLATFPHFADAEARRDWVNSYATPRRKNMLDWLAANQEPLELALDATTRPSCAFNPAGRDLWTIADLESLVGTEAYRRIASGDLQGALDCELALLHMAAHMRMHQSKAEGEWVALRTLDVIARYWSTRPGQTPEMLKARSPRSRSGVSACHTPRTR